MGTREITEKEKEIGKRVAEIRKHYRFKQQEFADRVGLSRPFIAQVETGIAALSARSINTICNTFSINQEWLIEGKGKMIVEPSKKEAISYLFADVLNDDPYKVRIIEGLSKLNSEELKALAAIIDKISGANSEE